MNEAHDYGEPWKAEPGTHSIGDTGDFDGYVELRTREEIRVAEVWNPDDILEAFFDRIVACVNACAGIADPAAEIEALRAALAEATGHLSAFLGWHGEAMTLDQVRSVSATLAKAQAILPGREKPEAGLDAGPGTS